MREPTAQTTRRRAPLIVPAGLILAGLYLLASNLGLDLPNIWPLLLRFWPLLLIVVGLELLLSRWRRGVGLLLGLLLSGAFFVTLYLAGDLRLDAQAVSERIAAPLEGAPRAEVVLDVGAAELQLGSLPQESSSLAEGNFESRYLTLDQELARHGETLRLELDTDGSSLLMPAGGSTLSLDLSRRIPLGLTVDVGASQFQLDLAELRVEQLRVSTGASDGTIILPGRGAGSIQLEVGASSLILVVPPGAAARIRVDSSASSVQLENPRLRRQGELYVSEGDGADGTLEVEIEAGAASITLR